MMHVHERGSVDVDSATSNFRLPIGTAASVTATRLYFQPRCRDLTPIAPRFAVYLKDLYSPFLDHRTFQTHLTAWASSNRPCQS